jgi:hypothetical protein
VISFIELSLAPGVSGFDGTLVANQFNPSLQQELGQLPTKPNLLWIDANSFLNDAVTHPSAHGLTNVSDSIAFEAGDGIPSTIPSEEQSGYFFYDDIHPSTSVHQQFATFVANHLRLEKDATDAFLVTDSALTLDDRSGFESHGLAPTESDFDFTSSTFESHHRSKSLTLGGFEAYWELGLKQRFTHRSGTSESGAASLDLAYDSETLATTNANLELGLHLTNKLLVELSLNPVFAHHGGQISARQTSGFNAFTTADQSAYDVHTARATLIYAPTSRSNFSAGFLVGTDDTWSANLGYGIHF